MFDEPAFGIAPILGRLAVRLHPADRRHWVELAVTSAGAQDRIAAARLEVPTAGWTTVDLRAAVALLPDLTLRIGVENLGNRAYATHLNTLNPFTGARILERGRSFYVGLGYGS